ncbi:MAG: hypothetical protein U9N45_04650 [Gemmatimonadota bacterium]|nr:hypothetical protein [Gemmatimonadota bacterium]
MKQINRLKQLSAGFIKPGLLVWPMKGKSGITGCGCRIKNTRSRWPAVRGKKVDYSHWPVELNN